MIEANIAWPIPTDFAREAAADLASDGADAAVAGAFRRSGGRLCGRIGDTPIAPAVVIIRWAGAVAAALRVPTLAL